MIAFRSIGAARQRSRSPFYRPERLHHYLWSARLILTSLVTQRPGSSMNDVHFKLIGTKE
ncbi:hypothetical protein JG687_00011552 [Phytophthora cactorum]|uniref:Uncharacterized protein n=1 Tax=Phytophthora cactorum TaxID=29920 RepID=A0A8T1U416_9STRA|nr:hypothetical protein JG687_00011552 [Phytophthora cactorum]